MTDTTGERCLTLVLLLDAPVSGTPKPNPVESLFTDMTLRTQWERAVKRRGFVASAVLCSEHFKADDFDRTGQTVRLRHGVTPSVFSFSSHLQKQVQPRTTRNSRKTEDSPAVDQLKAIREAQPQSNVRPIPEAATVGLMDKIKNARLNAALARVESLEHARRNCMIRERRAKKNLDALLEELRETSLINAELRQRLEGDSGPCLSLSPTLSP
ncbi:THAP domain-containing protein 6-like isoform 3-T4 [Synchiropus picturatus]